MNKSKISFWAGLSFVLGLGVAGALLFLGYFENGSRTHNANNAKAPTALEPKKPAFEFHATLALPVSEETKTLTSAPKRLFAAVTPAGYSWASIHRHPGIAPLPGSWSMPSLPYEARIELPASVLEMSAGKQADKRKVPLRFSFIACTTVECENAFTIDPIGAAQKFPHPHLLYTEVIKEVDLDRPGPITLGRVYFRGIYEQASGITCRPQKLRVILTKKIQHPDAKGIAYVVRTSTEFVQLAFGSKIYPLLQQGVGLESFLDIIGQVDFDKTELRFDAAPTALSELSKFTPYYLVFCRASESKVDCINRFARKNILEGRASLRDEFFPLVPKHNIVPRCDYAREIELFAFPFNASTSSPEQFQPSDKDPSIPREIVDSALSD